jgi:hypothetical protein
MNLFNPFGQDKHKNEPYSYSFDIACRSVMDYGREQGRQEAQTNNAISTYTSVPLPGEE